MEHGAADKGDRFPRGEHTWSLLRRNRCDYLVVSVTPLRWMLVERLAFWLVGPRWCDWIGQRLAHAADKRCREVSQVPLTVDELYGIDPYWADLCHRIALDEDGEVWQ